MNKESLYDFYSLSEKEYYIKRNKLKETDYEESYWVRVTDPDGIKRNRIDFSVTTNIFISN